jgi:hypothetical protein
MSRASRIALLGAAIIFGAAFSSALSAQRGEKTSGQAIFRFDTFGDEQLWTDVLRMHEVIATVSPKTALSVGLKVDVEALPPSLVAALRDGQVNLDDPAVTLGQSGVRLVPHSTDLYRRVERSKRQRSCAP